MLKLATDAKLDATYRREISFAAALNDPGAMINLTPGTHTR